MSAREPVEASPAREGGRGSPCSLPDHPCDWPEPSPTWSSMAAIEAGATEPAGAKALPSAEARSVAFV